VNTTAALAPDLATEASFFRSLAWLYEPHPARPPDQVINCLVEGNSIPLYGASDRYHRDTIMRLMVEVGTGCAALGQ
jgi:hypothetical protein